MQNSLNIRIVSFNNGEVVLNTLNDFLNHIAWVQCLYRKKSFVQAEFYMLILVIKGYLDKVFHIVACDILKAYVLCLQLDSPFLLNQNSKV